ncbi:MAG: hypothetical protein Q4A84_02430 [Neisseria sp.]|uniref:hypothetical protein n=1 Tax=Neisseria sp. TaxID=192066 RepID=UPI0026DC0AA9|nr:hypothetical protein [Neisseria sp.]MDO4640549.1 hypothetical protein [Neisseria sp.]
MMNQTTQTWHYTRFRRQSLVDMWKILSVFGLPVLACVILTVYLFMSRGIGIASISSALLSAALISAISIFMWRTWHDVRDFRAEDNYVSVDDKGLDVCEAGRLQHFAWNDIFTVQEFYALGYGCNLKVVLKNIRDDGLYEHYSFNVDGVPDAAVMYGKESMMSQILARWERWQADAAARLGA